MTQSNSPESYIDCKALWERAFASERGIRIPMGSPGRAINLVQRLNKYRQIDRRENKQIYPEGDPMHGKSRFDPFSARVNGDAVEIRALTISDLQIEDLE